MASSSSSSHSHAVADARNGFSVLPDFQNSVLAQTGVRHTPQPSLRSGNGKLLNEMLAAVDKSGPAVVNSSMEVRSAGVVGQSRQPAANRTLMGAVKRIGGDDADKERPGKKRCTDSARSANMPSAEAPAPAIAPQASASAGSDASSRSGNEPPLVAPLPEQTETTHWVCYLDGHMAPWAPTTLSGPGACPIRQPLDEYVFNMAKRMEKMPSKPSLRDRLQDAGRVCHASSLSMPFDVHSLQSQFNAMRYVGYAEVVKYCRTLPADSPGATVGIFVGTLVFLADKFSDAERAPWPGSHTFARSDMVECFAWAIASVAKARGEYAYDAANSKLEVAAKDACFLEFAREACAVLPEPLTAGLLDIIEPEGNYFFVSRWSSASST